MPYNAGGGDNSRASLTFPFTRQHRPDPAQHADHACTTGCASGYAGVNGPATNLWNRARAKAMEQRAAPAPAAGLERRALPGAGPNLPVLRRRGALRRHFGGGAGSSDG